MYYRFLSVMLVLITVILFPYCADAMVLVTYKLREIDLNISIPENYIVFTRNIDPNNQNIERLGYTKYDLYSMFVKNNIYLNAYDFVSNTEIVVIVTDSEIDDLSSLNDIQFNYIVNGAKSSFSNYGVTCIESDIFHTRQAKFIRNYICKPLNNSLAYGLQYYTVIGGKSVNITINSYSGMVDENLKYIINQIIENVEFNSINNDGETMSHTSKFKYVDYDCKLTFTILDNWIEVPLSKQREYIDARFDSTLDSKIMILYGSKDIWNEYHLLGRTMLHLGGISREDVDNSFVTVSDVAGFIGIQEEKIKMVKYGKYEYYEYKAPSKYEVNGVEIEINMTQIARFSNGYLYIIQHNIDNNNIYHKDIETMLESVDNF